MSNKKNKKKPRTISIGIGAEDGSNIEIRWSEEAHTLSYRIDKEGKTVQPVNTTISASYDRPNKNPKVLVMASSPKLPLLLDFNEMLSRYEYVVAVDTSYKNVGKNQICATCIVFWKVQLAPEGMICAFQSAYGLEFWNPLAHPEKIGWQKAIQLIQSFKSYSDEQRLLLIVYPFIHEIPEYNLHSLPIIDDYYLPENFQMLYATSDSENEFLANILFSNADKESKKLWRLVAQCTPVDMDSEAATPERCTFFKLWIPTIIQT